MWSSAVRGHPAEMRLLCAALFFGMLGWAQPGWTQNAPAKAPASDPAADEAQQDRKSTRLNSSHLVISYAVFCLKKKKHNPVHPLAQPSHCSRSGLRSERSD